MTPRRAILAVLLAAALPAAAGDVRAWLYRSAAAESDTMLGHPNCVAYWDAALGVELDGTNVVSWTDQKNGIVAAATNDAMRPYFVSGNFGGAGSLLFDGTKALNLSADVELSNSTTFVIGWRADGAKIFMPLGTHDADAPPAPLAIWNNNTTYSHFGHSNTGVIYTGSGVWTGNICAVVGNDGSKNVTTNNHYIRRSGTNVQSLAYNQAATKSTVNRIGGRKTEKTVGMISLIAHFRPALTVQEIVEFEAQLIEERFAE